MSTNWKFTDVTNRVVHRTLDDGTQESCLSSAIDPSIIPDSADQPTHNQVIDAQIAALEVIQVQNLTPRAIREFFLAIITQFGLDPHLNPGTAALAHVQDQIVALRSQRT